MPDSVVPFWIIATFLFALGTVIGSFLNVCIHRIPAKAGFWESLKGLYHPPSRCPHCFRRIPAADNIPVVGWLKIGGRCRFCRARISPRYPLVEFFNGVLFVALYWYEMPGWPFRYEDSPLFVPGYWQQSFPASWLDAVWVLHLRYFYHLVLIEALLVATFIDIDLRIIPDGATLPAMAVGVLGSAALPQMQLVPLWFQSPHLLRSFHDLLPPWLGWLAGSTSTVPAWLAQHPHLHGLAISIAGIIVGGGIVWAVRAIGFWVLRREAMGFGDVVLMGMVGSFLGWQAAVAIFFIAPACALAVVAAVWIVRRDREIPYGPYLSLAALILLFGWPHLWPHAERIFSLGPMLVLLALMMGGTLVATLYMVQGIKRLLGIATDEPLWIEEWTSGDQLAHYAGEQHDAPGGQWPHDNWPGELSGRGALFNEAWRRGWRKGR